MEKLWSSMWLKEKREQRQPTLQVLAAFQCKAVNTQQTVTSTDDTLDVEVLRATTSKITKIVRVGKRMRGQRACQKGSPNSAAPTAGGGTPLTTCVGPTAGDRSIPVLLCKEISWRAPTTRVQESKAGLSDRTCIGVTDRAIAGVLLVNDSPGRKATRKTKRTKQMRSRASSHLSVGTVVTSTTDADAQKTLNHKMAKRPRQPNHQLRTRPLPRPSRAGLSKCRLTISTIIRFSHQRRENLK